MLDHLSAEHDNLAAHLLHGALERGHGDRVALREPDCMLTFAEVADRVARAATGLRALRVLRGERVAVFMPDSVDAAVALLGAVHHGAVAVPVSELALATELRDILFDSGAAVVIAHESLLETLAQVRGELPALREVVAVGSHGPAERDFASMMLAAAPSPPAIVEPEAPAFLLYSAGARAVEAGERRRGVPHAHAAPLIAFESFARSLLDLSADDRVFSVARLWTAYGLSAGLLFPLAAGAEAILLPEQAHSDVVFDLLEDAAPTVFFATPSVYGQLSHDAVTQGRVRPLAHLRASVSGAEDMPPKVIDRVRDVLGTDVMVGYGLTEAFGFVLAGPGTGRPGACGRPVPGFELRLIGEAGQPVGPDEIGTLELRGATVAQRYWGDDEPAVDAEGWFRTPDRFLVDHDGNYHHCGRVDQLFKVGGKWVSPAEVERALLGHEAVWECAVIGADDEDGLMKPFAYVVANIGHSPGPALEAELREYVRRELSPYKYPRWIEFVTELPKGPHGKVLRYKLRDRLKASHRRRTESSAP